MRVELSTGRSRGGGGGGGGGGGRYGGGGEDKCYQCGERGHFARDCGMQGRGGGGSRGRRERYGDTGILIRERDVSIYWPRTEGSKVVYSSFFASKPAHVKLILISVSVGITSFADNMSAGIMRLVSPGNEGLTCIYS